MGRILNKRKSEVESADFFDDESLRPNPQIKTFRRFRDPVTLYSDWHNELYEDKPYVNWWFDIVHDWYNKPEEPYRIRAQQTPIDWKSKIGNSDMSTNFKVEHNVEIYKGDYAIREDGALYLLNWNVQNHANNQATQSVECNDYITFMRERRTRVDGNAFLLPEREDGKEYSEDGKYEIIVKDIPASHSLYTGRPDYSVSTGIPGVTSNDLMSVFVQWNSETQKIRVDDIFRIGFFTYHVVDIVTSEVRMDKSHGVLDLYAKRVPGGVIA